MECTHARRSHEVDELQNKRVSSLKTDDDHVTPTKKSKLDIDDKTGSEGDYEDSVDENDYGDCGDDSDYDDHDNLKTMMMLSTFPHISPTSFLRQVIPRSPGSISKVKVKVIDFQDGRRVTSLHGGWQAPILNQAVLECKVGGNSRSPRKPVDKRHCPARIPHAKIREWPDRGINSCIPKVERESIVSQGEPLTPTRKGIHARRHASRQRGIGQPWPAIGAMATSLARTITKKRLGKTVIDNRTNYNNDITRERERTISNALNIEILRADYGEETSSIGWHESHTRKSGIEPGSPWWVPSSLTTTPSQPRGCYQHVFMGGATVTERSAYSPPTKRPSWFNTRPGNSGFSHVGIVPDDANGQRFFSGISRLPHPFIPRFQATRRSICECHIALCYHRSCRRSLAGYTLVRLKLPCRVNIKSPISHVSPAASSFAFMLAWARKVRRHSWGGQDAEEEGAGTKKREDESRARDGGSEPVDTSFIAK
ncbi:hypothetical protein PR048_012086 [Dryococelus australis]|uniref:Uncharacterized protein n=1 Tax=Dryococelus australis TaxID=614101 RepID=A0ABQ9HNX6_9NEOP|nr:hypothetical protein PR048_012086 [Dryococelus australis]